MMAVWWLSDGGLFDQRRLVGRKERGAGVLSRKPPNLQKDPLGLAFEDRASMMMYIFNKALQVVRQLVQAEKSITNLWHVHNTHTTCTTKDQQQNIRQGSL